MNDQWSSAHTEGDKSVSSAATLKVKVAFVFGGPYFPPNRGDSELKILLEGVEGL